MNPDHIHIMLDMYLACVVAAVLAFGIYHFVRKQSPETGWNYHGNVQTSAYGKVDLGGIGVLLAVYAGVFLLTLNPPEDNGEAAQMQENMSPSSIAILTFVLGLITQAIPVGIVLLFLATRYNVFELFGLKHVNWKKVWMWAGIGLGGGYIIALIATAVFQPLITDRLGSPEVQEAVRLVYEAKKTTTH